MNVRKLILLIAICGLLGCAGGGKESSVKIVEGSKLSDYIDYKEYIALETTDSCLISNIRRAWRDTNYIIVHDDPILTRESYIYLFSSEGKFLNRVGAVGRGPEEYLYAQNVFVDREHNYVGILCSYTKRLLLYSYDGAFIKAYKVNSGDIYMDYIESLPDGKLLGHNGLPPRLDEYVRNVPEDSKYEYRLLTPNGDSLISKPLTGKTFWESKLGVYHVITKPMVKYQGEVLGVSLLSHDVWRYNNGELEPEYTFEIERKLVDSAFLNQNKELEPLDVIRNIGNAGLSYGYSEIASSDGYLLMRINLVLNEILIFDGQRAILVEDGDLWGLSEDNLANMGAELVLGMDDSEIDSPELLKIRETLAEDDNPILYREHLKKDLMNQICF